MEKKAIIYPPANCYFEFLNVFRKNFLLTTYYILLTALFFCLPGQNYYQTLTFASQKPLVREVPISYSPPAPYPILTGSYPKDLSAQGIVVMDIPSGILLFGRNTSLPLTPASTTKIMTAIICLENYRLDQMITAKEIQSPEVNMGLKIGDKLTVENLLYGLLVGSGNDAAFVLADNYPDGYEQFINSMNKKAKELNMQNTHFNNVSGLEEYNHYATALDLARLTTYALKNPVFAKIVSIPEITVPNYNFTKWYQLKNINKLLGEIPGVSGVKTGYTEEAGECLVATVNRGDRKILTVVLKSKDRFGETASLIDWVFKNFRWDEIK